MAKRKGQIDFGLGKNEKRGSRNAALKVMAAFFNIMNLWDEFMMNFYNYLPQSTLRRIY